MPTNTVVLNTQEELQGKRLLIAEGAVPLLGIFIDTDPASPPLPSSWIRVNTGPPDSVVLAINYSGGLAYIDLATLNS